ncbi:CBS domain-containing protein [Candidatus Micrarchaeota archaeon]|nr:CBS domain-containing protein [Candidatus Micrarchaeota archaeon]
MKVRDVYEKNSGFVDKVLETDSIEKVIEVMAENKSTRTVFVVDAKMNLLGVITIREIFGQIFNKMKPEILKIFNKKKDLKAGDIMKVVISVSLDDDLDNAFRAAIVSNLQDLPVCEKGKIVGELDCFELLDGLIAKDKNYFKK